MKKKYLTLLLVLSGFPFYAQLLAQDSLSLSVNFTGMTPHVGQDLTLYLRDTVSGDFADSLVVSPIQTADFLVSFDSVLDGSYYLDFYADFNENGMYDVPPTDHAWRIVLKDLSEDSTVNFVHNTDFTDITWADAVDSLHQITLDFTGMTPHVGQDLYLYVRNADDGSFVDSLTLAVDNADFSVAFDSVPPGDYNVDFYADLNQNGSYDAPPTDHAWRIELPDFMADTTLAFAHNTDFTDIFPAGDGDTYQLTISFVDMDPHVDQDLILYLRDPDSGDFIDSVKVIPVSTADFEVVFDSVAKDTDYNLDFYADLNQNGVYDVPPADHAWRIMLTGIMADTTIEFVHNTDFTDIGLGVPTGVGDVEDLGFSAYPNPVKDELNVRLLRSGTDLSIYNVTGALVLQRALTPSDTQVNINVSALKPGMYILKLNSGSSTGEYKFLKE